jgi:hypothetical protein
MALEALLKSALLGSIAAGRLAVMCGAGLSMARPSNIPSAKAVAQKCFDTYRARIDPNIDPAIRDDLEAVAEYAKAHVDFRAVFIKTIVPWDAFSTPPNQGHQAVADFVLTRASAACLTANYDILVERCGWDWGAQFNTALDGAQANATVDQSPFLKFHGCGFKDQERTVWTSSQFVSDPEIAARKASCEGWIQANLQDKDLLFVGFWSDWSYLNKAISESFNNTHPRSIVLVDPGDSAFLQGKAPELWALAHQVGITFTHVQESGDKFLAELRKAFSEAFLRELLRIGADAFAAFRPGVIVNQAWHTLPDLSNEQLYSWRRDAEGKTARQPATRVKPDVASPAVALAHILVRGDGWVEKGSGYEKAGKTVRIVNAGGGFVDSTRRAFSEPPAVMEADIVICAGASDLGVPADVVRDADPANVIRGGSGAIWLDLPTAINELHL